LPILFQVIPPSVVDSQYKILPVYPLSIRNPELVEFGQTEVAPETVPPTDCASILTDERHVRKTNI
jgi:hypothetical protein